MAISTTAAIVAAAVVAAASAAASAGVTVAQQQSAMHRAHGEQNKADAAMETQRQQLAKEQAQVEALAEKDRKKRANRATTMLTSPQGVQDKVFTNAPSLMGGGLKQTLG